MYTLHLHVVLFYVKIRLQYLNVQIISSSYACHVFYSNLNLCNNIILGMELSLLAVLSRRTIVKTSLCLYCQKKQQENLIKKPNIEAM